MKSGRSCTREQESAEWQIDPMPWIRVAGMVPAAAQALYAQQRIWLNDLLFSSTWQPTFVLDPRSAVDLNPDPAGPRGTVQGRVCRGASRRKRLLASGTSRVELMCDRSPTSLLGNARGCWAKDRSRPRRPRVLAREPACPREEQRDVQAERYGCWWSYGCVHALVHSTSR